MKERILKIMHGVPQSEPAYLLEFEYRKLISEEQKKEFLQAIQQIALNGSDREKFLSLSAIEILDKAQECVDIIKFNIENIELNNNEKKISPLLFLCASLSSTWSIDFIRKVMLEFKPRMQEYSYYFDLSIRSIIKTIY
jgi:hypothetical protein